MILYYIILRIHVCFGHYKVCHLQNKSTAPKSRCTAFCHRCLSQLDGPPFRVEIGTEQMWILTDLKGCCQKEAGILDINGD